MDKKKLKDLTGKGVTSVGAFIRSKWVICLTLALATLVVREQLKKKGKRFWLTRLRGLCVCIAVAVFAAYNFGFDLVPQESQQGYSSIWQLTISLAVLAAIAYVLRQRNRCNPKETLIKKLF